MRARSGIRAQALTTPSSDRGTLPRVAPPQDDDALLRAWQDGDGAAGTKLFERHFEAVARFFRNKTDGPLDDLVQRTFLGCLEGRDRIRGESGFRGYLFGVARNVLRKSWQARAPARSLDEIDDASIVQLGASPCSAYARDRSQLAMLNALRRIPLQAQLVLELCYWEQMSAREVAGVLGVPLGTAKTRIRRARTLLTRELAAVASQSVPLHSTATRLDTWARGVAQRAPGGAEETPPDAIRSPPDRTSTS